MGVRSIFALGNPGVSPQLKFTLTERPVSLSNRKAICRFEVGPKIA